MGTNFYIRRVEPREVHDLMHIAKRSAGWVIHFQDSEDGYDEPLEDAPEPPAFHSVADIRRLLESGEWQLCDEYGDVREPGADSLRAFDELCAWMGGDGFGWSGTPPNPNYPEGEPPYESVFPGSYRDPDGYIFTGRCFR